MSEGKTYNRPRFDGVNFYPSPEKDIFSLAGGTDENGISSEHRRYRDEVKKLLGPMVPALLRDCGGSLDVSKVKVKDFAEFKSFLQRQAELNDGKSFHDPYQSLLEDENFEPLLKLLYQEINTDFYVVISVTETEALFKEFQAKLIEIDAEVFVRNQYNSKEGRENIRHVLGDASAFTKDQRSEVLKSVAKAAEEEEILWFGKGHGLRLTDHVSLFNYFNWGVGEEEIAHATGIAKDYLKAADERDQERAIQEEQYSKNPEEVRVALLREVLGRKISKLEIQEMAHLAKSGVKDPDPRKQVQGHLAELWLLAVDTRSFGQNTEEAYGINAYILEKTEALIEASKKIQSDEELQVFNEKLQEFLNGPIAALEKGGARRWLKHQTMGLGLKEQLEDYPAETRRPYEQLVHFSDQWKYALDCGEKILLDAPRKEAVDPKVEEAKNQLIVGLQKTQQELWYGYKQHKAISRGMSQVSDLANPSYHVAKWLAPDQAHHLAIGDYAEIESANRELDKMVEQLQKAGSKEEVEAQIEKLNELIQEDGILYEAFQAAEMDGTEQVLGLVQTVAILLGTAQATRGASLVVEGAEAVFLADKMFRGFFWGAYMATAENAVATTTGEVRTERDTIGNWTKDAVSTGASMALVMPAAGSVGSALEGNALKNLAARYLNPGGLVRLAGDTGLETLEEAVDQQLRKMLDGRANALSPTEIKELFKLCLAGGGFQIGALAKNFQGQVEAQASKAADAKLEPAASKTDEKHSRKNPLLHPLLAPMWTLMGVGGLGGSDTGAGREVSYRERRNELLDKVVQSADPKQERDLVAKVLEHSVEDGLELADRLNLSPAELRKAILQPEFALKHSDLMLELVKQIRLSNSFEVKSFLDEAREISPQWPWPDSRSEESEREIIERLSKMRWFEPEGPLFDAIEDFYLDAFMTRSPVQPASLKIATDTEPPATRMARRYLEGLEGLFEKDFHSFRQVQQMRQAVVEQELKAEIHQAKPGMQVELDPETDRYRLVAKVKGAEGSNPGTRQERREAFESKVLSEMESLLREDPSLNKVVAKCLAGFDSDRAWVLREQIYGENPDKPIQWALAEGLAGLDSERAWKMRNRILNIGNNMDYVASGLKGVESERAWRLRPRAMNGGVASGLAGLDSERAWALRERFLKETPGEEWEIVESLVGLDSPRAWEMRDRLDSLDTAESEGWLGISLMGLDSDRAWALRERLIEEGRGFEVAHSLAGLDSERAWEMRSRLLEDRGLEDDVAMSLANLNSARAWALRRELLAKGIKKSSYLESLGGDNTSFFKRLHPDWDPLSESTEAPASSTTKERLAVFEKRALEEMERLLTEGADSNHVARGLAGMDSDAAWDLRNRLWDEGKTRKVEITLGLAGLDSKRAWEMRAKSLREGQDPVPVALSLAGLDSKKAWEMRDWFLGQEGQEGSAAASLIGLDSKQAWDLRNRLVEEGSPLSMVAMSLTGLDSREAWDMRKHFLSLALTEGDPSIQGYISGSLAGLDSREAWGLRHQLLNLALAANDTFLLGEIAQGLAGLDSMAAWEMRRGLLVFANKRNDGFLKGDIAKGLAGLASEEAWQMRSELAEEGAEKGAIAEGLGGSYLSFVWRLRPEWALPVESEADEIRLLNLVHNPTLPEIQEYLGETAPDPAAKLEEARESLGHLPVAAKILTDMSQLDRDTARDLLKTNSALPDRAPAELARALLQRLFPGMTVSRFSFGSGFPSSVDSKPSPATAFQDRSEMLLSGGGFQMIQDQRPLIQSREAMDAFLVNGVYGRLDPNSQHWEKVQFPTRPETLEPAQEATLTLLDAKNAGRISLPIPHDGRLIPERIHGLNARGEEIPLRPLGNALGQRTVEVPPGVVKILYSIQRPLAAEPMKDVTAPGFSAFLRGLEPESRRDLTAPLQGLPHDLLAELRRPEFTALSPKEKVIRIEAMVRELGWYDIHNEEVAEEKQGKTPAEQILIAERRMEELRRQDPTIPPHKRFAGVCADFTLITIALLRAAGIPTGLLSGVNLRGQEAQIRNVHVTAFVPWPDAKGGIRIVPVDGTPSDSDAEQPAARLSLAELEVQAGKEAAAPVEKTETEVAELLKQAKAESVEAILELKNGELERALNVILRHEVKLAHVGAIRRVLEAYWYHGMDRSQNARSPGELSEFFQEEITRERQATGPEALRKPAGAQLMATLRDFVERFQRDPAISSSRKALDLLKDIALLADSGLSDVERRALAAVLSYLRAESMQSASKTGVGGSGSGGALGLLLATGAGLATLLGASEAEAAVTAVSEIGQGGFSNLGAGLAAFAVGGIFHWLAKRLQREPVDDSGEDDVIKLSQVRPPQKGSPYRFGRKKRASDLKIPSLLAQLASGSFEERESAASSLLDIGQDAVPGLIDLLSHPEDLSRLHAIIILRDLGVDGLVDRFREMLELDPCDSVRKMAAQALVNFGQIKTYNELLPLLNDEYHGVRTVAIRASKDLQIKEAIPDLWRLIKNSNPLVRFHAAVALKDFGEFKTIEDIQGLVKDEACSLIACQVLSKIGGIEDIELFRYFLKSENPALRKTALRGLVKIDSKEIVEDLTSLFDDEDPDIRQIAAQKLNEINKGPGSSGALGLLLAGGAGLATLLGASDAQAAVVSEIGGGGLFTPGNGLAAFALGGIFHWLAKRLQGKTVGDSTTDGLETSAKAVAREVQALMTRLANSFSEEKIGLRAALVALGGEAVPALLAFLSHKNGQARLEAVMALKALDARESADEIGKLLKDPDGFVRAQAAVTLAEWGRIRTVEEVQVLLEDESDLVKHMGIEAVVKHGIRDALPELWRLAEDRKGVAAHLAVDALEKMGELRTVEALRRLKVEPNSWSSPLFAESLAKVGGVGELDLFRRFLQDKDPAVRETVVWGLIQIDSEEILGDLIPLLKDKNPNVRFLADKKIKQLCGVSAPKTDYKLNATAAPALLGLDMLLHGHPTPLGLAFSAASLVTVGGIFHWLAKWIRQKSEAETDSESPPDEVVEEIQTLAAQMLEKADWEEGIQRLVNYGPKAVSALLPFLQIGDRQVCWEVLRALAAFDARETVDSVRALLKDPDDYIQMWAAMLLDDWGEFKSVEDIRALLNHPNDSLKNLGIEAVVKGNIREALPKLWQMVEAGNLTWQALEALEKLGELRDFDKLRRLNVEPNRLLTPILIQALAQGGGIGELDLFRRFLAEKNFGLRETLVQRLIKIESEEILPDLVQLLRDPNPKIRSMASTRMRELSGAPAPKPGGKLNAVAAPALLGLDLLLEGHPSWLTAIGTGITTALLLAGAGGPYRKKAEDARSEPVPLRDLPLSPQDADAILKFLEDFHRRPRTPPSAEILDAEAAWESWIRDQLGWRGQADYAGTPSKNILDEALDDPERSEKVRLILGQANLPWRDIQNFQHRFKPWLEGGRISELLDRLKAQDIDPWEGEGVEKLRNLALLIDFRKLGFMPPLPTAWPMAIAVAAVLLPFGLIGGLMALCHSVVSEVAQWPGRVYRGIRHWGEETVASLRSRDRVRIETKPEPLEVEREGEAELYEEADGSNAETKNRFHALAAPALLGGDMLLHGQPTAAGLLVTGLAAAAGVLGMVRLVHSRKSLLNRPGRAESIEAQSIDEEEINTATLLDSFKIDPEQGSPRVPVKLSLGEDSSHSVYFSSHLSSTRLAGALQVFEDIFQEKGVAEKFPPRQEFRGDRGHLIPATGNEWSIAYFRNELFTLKKSGIDSQKHVLFQRSVDGYPQLAIHETRLRGDSKFGAKQIVQFLEPDKPRTRTYQFSWIGDRAITAICARLGLPVQGRDNLLQGLAEFVFDSGPYTPEELEGPLRDESDSPDGVLYKEFKAKFLGVEEDPFFRAWHSPSGLAIMTHEMDPHEKKHSLRLLFEQGDIERFDEAMPLGKNWMNFLNPFLSGNWR